MISQFKWTTKIMWFIRAKGNLPGAWVCFAMLVFSCISPAAPLQGFFWYCDNSFFSNISLEIVPLPTLLHTHHTSKKQESWDSRLRKSSLRQFFRFLDVCHLPSHPLPHSFCNFSTDVTNCSASIEKKLLFSWVCFSAMCQTTSKIARQTFFICSYNLILILICSSWMKLMWIFVVAVCCWIMLCSQCWGQLDDCLTWHLFVRWIFLVVVYSICGIQT